MLVHPKSIKAVGEAAFDAFIASLHYGTVVVNIPAPVAGGLPNIAWGAYPGGVGVLTYGSHLRFKP